MKLITKYQAFIDMIPGSSKKHLVETLDYFDVNRVEYYSLSTFIGRQFSSGKLFGLRSLFVQHAKTYYGIKYNEILHLLEIGKIDPEKYIACDSLKIEDATILVMNGEVSITKSNRQVEQVTPNFALYDYNGILNFKKGQSCRAANRDIHTPTSKIIKRWRDMPGSLIDLIWIKNLIGYVIEFSIYTQPVGMQNKQLLIWEIRKY